MRRQARVHEGRARRKAMALVLVVRARRPFCFGDRMNKIEQIKVEKDGLDVGADIPRYAQLGFEAIEEGDLERLKWWGVFFRRHTPGYSMMRIRIPNGITNAVQLSAIGGITDRCGRGFADITTRQQVQLRWIRIGDVPAILDQLRGVGLLTLQTGMDNIRNVVGCPVAGLTPNELLDASPVVRAFTETFVGSRAYTNLPRKFNVTITGCRENCTHPETQDLALVPARKSVAGAPVEGFNVLVGGKNGSGGYRVAAALDVFVRPGEAAELCSAVVLIFRDHGPRDARNKVRLAFLLEDWGEATFREVLETRLGRALERAGADARLPKATDHVGVFRQKQATLNSVGLLVPVGRITGDQLIELARLASSYGTGEIRLTPDQNVIIVNVPCDALPQVLEGLIRHIDPEKVRRQLRSLSPTPAAGAPTADTEATPVISPDALAEGAGRLLTVHGVEVAVFRCQNHIHAMQNRCPHEGGALSGGTLDGGDVICPLHGYRFNLETGACSTDPALRAKIFALVPHAGGFTVEARPDQTHHSA